MTDHLDRVKAALADRYTVEREIGAGGMATVYLAQDVRHDRQVAIKVLRPDLAATLGPERFHREIKIAAQLQHPNILPLLDSGEAADFLYYVMPYIEGQSLRDRLAKEGELPIGDAVRLLRDVVDALTEAHAHGVVHRDIKPENILLRGRHALVTDFGVAKAVSEATGRQQLTTAGVALGTPAYMAPEQAAADPHLDHRVDIYAVGAVAYELLTGRPVFMGTTPQMVLAAHVTEAPQPVRTHRDTVPAALEAVVMRCLEKKPADRFQSAEELLPQLEALATPSGGMTPTSTQPVSAVPSAPRGLWWRVVAPVAAVLLAVGLWAALRDGASNTQAASGQPATGQSIAVLPFTDLSAGVTEEYFADGLTEEVVVALSRVPGLRVPGSASTFFFKDSKSELAAIAESLNVRSVLTGSVQRDADRVRIRVQLLNAADGFQLWSETYERRLEDMFEVYDDVTRSIAGALQVHLAGRGKAVAAAPPTRSPAAYDAYLLGKYHLDHRKVDSALTYLTRAVEHDTNFVLAWSALADAHSLSVPSNTYVSGVSAGAAIAAAEEAARRAVALDSLSGPAHAALAAVFDGQFRWEEAGRAWRTALTLDPDNAHARHWYGIHLLTVGRPAAALAEVRRARELDPLSQIVGIYVGPMAMEAGDTTAAVRETVRLTELFPRSRRVAMEASLVFLRAGRLEAAAEQYAKWWELRGADSASVQRVREGVRVRDRETLRMIADSIADGWYLPITFLAAGDTAAAFEAIRSYKVAPGEVNAADLLMYGGEALRQMPEFRSVLQRMNLRDRM